MLYEPFELNDRDVVRFYARVGLPDEKGCMKWEGGLLRGGYGAFAMRKGRYRSVGAHRVAFLIETGVCANNCVCHTCDVASCCNPDHLYDGTQKQNVADAFNRKRRSGKKGVIHPLSRLTEDDVLLIRKLTSEGAPQRSMALKFNISDASISNIVKRKSWRHIP